MRFVDANVLIYAAGNDPEEAAKRDAAESANPELAPSRIEVVD